MLNTPLFLPHFRERFSCKWRLVTPLVTVFRSSLLPQLLGSSASLGTLRNDGLLFSIRNCHCTNTHTHFIYIYIYIYTSIYILSSLNITLQVTAGQLSCFHFLNQISHRLLKTLCIYELYQRLLLKTTGLAAALQQKCQLCEDTVQFSKAHATHTFPVWSWLHFSTVPSLMNG